MPSTINETGDGWGAGAALLGSVQLRRADRQVWTSALPASLLRFAIVQPSHTPKSVLPDLLGLSSHRLLLIVPRKYTIKHAWEPASCKASVAEGCWRQLLAASECRKPPRELLALLCTAAGLHMTTYQWKLHVMQKETTSDAWDQKKPLQQHSPTAAPCVR
jgi:hypothetical protein